MNNLFDAALGCIIITDPTEKVQQSHATAKSWQTGQLNLNTTSPPKTILTPGLPTALRLVLPRQVPRRSLNTKAGQAALLHALAHIEFNAMNLAWDAIYRFRDLPPAYYNDMIQIADEEALHFNLLHQQLQQLGYNYGDLEAHNGLWEMAVKTASDVLARMALVPRILEARGLDATPPIIDKAQAHGLHPLVEILQRILHDEIGHVAIGSHWFHYFCAERGLNPDTTFHHLIEQYFTGRLNTPFNTEARLAACFSQQELDSLEKLMNNRFHGHRMNPPQQSPRR